MTKRQRLRDENGQLHCVDGPAVIYPNGSEYYHHGERHRLDGPAITYRFGNDYYHEYYHHGAKHRLDGPALLHPMGDEYWVNGEIPLTIMDILITDQHMVFDGELIPTVSYGGLDHKYRAYRFIDPDELALAVLYYS